MSAGLVTLFGAVGAVAAILAVLVPVILTQGKSLSREIDGQGADLRHRIDAQGAELHREIDAMRGDMGTLRGIIDSLRAELAEVRRDLHLLSDRVARIEGALTGPWRPTNGSGAAETRPAPAAPEA